jgi:DNA-binding XRE family transcriptional regulator
MPQEGTDVMANDRDARGDLGVWLGEELRCARLAAGYTSQDQFARELGFDRTVIVKAETGARPPSDDMAARIAEMFPDLCNGLYVRLAGIARKSNGPIPGWFADWVEIEAKATSLRVRGGRGTGRVAHGVPGDGGSGHHRPGPYAGKQRGTHVR